MKNNIKPEEVVQKQLDYYNNHNLEGFCFTYSDEIEVINLIDNTIIFKGKKALEDRYRERFTNPDLFAELTNRMVIGNKVIDYEEVSGIKEGEIVKAVAIYEIQENLIRRVWFLYED